MGKMSDLAVSLDDLCMIGQQLLACGEALIRAAASVKTCFSEAPPLAEVPAADPVSSEKHLLEENQDSVVERDAVEKHYSKEDVRALLASLSHSGFRAEARELVRRYSNGGSLTDVDPARYPELMREAEKFNSVAEK